MTRKRSSKKRRERRVREGQAARRGKNTQPEVVDLGIGTVMKRAGRAIYIQTARTDEEHAALLHQLEDARSTGRSKAERNMERIRELFKGGVVLPVLANLALESTVIDPETYKEYDSGPSKIYVEWASWMAVTSGEVAPAVENTCSRTEANELIRLLREVVDIQIFLNQTDDAAKEPTSRGELARRSRFDHLLVRGAAYNQHLAATNDALFRPHSDALEDVVGVSWPQLVLFLERLEHVLDGQLNDAKASEQRRLRQAHSLLASPAALDTDQSSLGSRLRELLAAGLDRNEVLSALCDDFFYETFHRAFVLNAADIACPGLDGAAAAKCLDLFSTDFGAERIGNSMPSVYEPLEKAPLLRLSDRQWFGNLAYKIPWAMRPRLEGALRSVDAKWVAYERGRSRFLEARALELLRSTSPYWRTWSKLKYKTGTDDAEYELDGLLMIDTALVVVEAKAGAIGGAGRRGAKSLFEDLKEVIGVAHQQAARAVNYIRNSESATFYAQNGQQVTVRGSDFTRVEAITVTLDDVTAFATHLRELHQSAIIPAKSAIWTVSIHDLTVIAELVEGASMLLHYLQRRLELEDFPITAHDELDWFGHYQQVGLFFEGMEIDGELRLLTHTTEMDDYFLHQAGVKQTRHPKPCQPMPGRMRSMLVRIEAQGRPGHIEAGIALLDCDGKTRDAFQNIVKTRLRRLRTQAFSMARMAVGDTVLCFVASLSPTQAELDAYVEASKYLHRAKRAVGFSEARNSTDPLLVSSLTYPWAESGEIAQRAKKVFGALQSKTTFEAEDGKELPYNPAALQEPTAE